MKEEFSHDLRTPLTVLKISLQFVLKKWAQLSEQDKREYILQTLLEVEKLESAIEKAEYQLQELEEKGAVLGDQDSASGS